MQFRFINNVKDGIPNLLSLGIDEAIFSSVSSENTLPTIRLSRVSKSGVSVGFHQNINDEVNVDVCKKLGIVVSRRLTAGGAVFHDQEIVYSITLPIGTPISPEDVKVSYETICNGLVDGLQLLGIDAKFKPFNDVIVHNKKISGSAQTRRSGFLLQQGTILMDVDVDKMFEILKVPKEKIKGKFIEEIKNSITSVRKELNRDISYIEVSEALKQGFIDCWKAELIEDILTDREIKFAELIVKETFGNDDWNYSIS